jgi:hypothetical protein
VNRSGGLASGFTGGRAGHRQVLRADGVRVGPDFRVDLGVYGWWPDPRTWKRLRLPADTIARFTGTERA